MNLFLFFALLACLSAGAIGFTLRGTALAPIRFVALTLMILTPLLALGIYLLIGEPEFPDQPLSPRISGALETLTPEALAVRIENRLSENGDDRQGWEILGLIRLREGLYRQAEHAFRRAAAIEETEAALSGLGEALAGEADGLITAESRLAFERALALDSESIRAPWFLGLAARQEGDSEKARRLWRGLLPRLPEDSGAYEEVVRALEDLER